MKTIQVITEDGLFNLDILDKFEWEGEKFSICKIPGGPDKNGVDQFIPIVVHNLSHRIARSSHSIETIKTEAITAFNEADREKVKAMFKEVNSLAKHYLKGFNSLKGKHSEYLKGVSEALRQME